MLTGSAVPYLHNGIMSADMEDATNFDYGEGKVRCEYSADNLS